MRIMGYKDSSIQPLKQIVSYLVKSRCMHQHVGINARQRRYERRNFTLRIDQRLMDPGYRGAIVVNNSNLCDFMESCMSPGGFNVNDGIHDRAIRAFSLFLQGVFGKPHDDPGSVDAAVPEILWRDDPNID